MCAFIAGLAVIGSLICAIRATIFVIFSQSIIRKIKCQIFDKVIAMPLGWYDKEEHHPQVITQKITTNCNMVYNFC